MVFPLSCIMGGAFRCGTNSVVECDLAKVEVAGSNPVSRSQEPRRPQPGLFNIWRRTQVVRERSAKPLCIGSNPIGASLLISPKLPHCR